MRRTSPRRKLVLAAGWIFAVALGGQAAAKDAPSAPAAAKVPAPATAPAPPRKATPEQRAEADRLDPLARAAFWAREADLDAQDREAGLKLASSLRALGRNEEAAAAAARVLVVDPNDRDALLEAARDYLAAGQGFYAIEPLTRLQASGARDWRLLSLLGVAYDQVSRGDDAEAAWREALQLSPNNPAVLSNLALHEAARGQSAEAEQLLRQAVAQPGATLQMRQNLALVLGMEGKLAEAERLERQDLPPELADANMAYLRAAAGGGGVRTWGSVEKAEAAVE
jgi:Flp pilus assembly protein TadD